MAITDAACLSHGMAAHTGEPEAALEAFRARRVQFQSRAIGEHVHRPPRARTRRCASKTDAGTLAWLQGGPGPDDADGPSRGAV